MNSNNEVVDDVFIEEKNVVVKKSLLDQEVRDEKSALGIMLMYLSNAQKCGLFGFEQSAKIWEAMCCLKNNVEPGEDPTFVKHNSLLDVKVNNMQDALYVVIGFLNILQKKGMFSFEESSKIASCIKIFKNN